MNSNRSDADLACSVFKPCRLTYMDDGYDDVQGYDDDDDVAGDAGHNQEGHNKNNDRSGNLDDSVVMILGPFRGEDETPPKKKSCPAESGVLGSGLALSQGSPGKERDRSGAANSAESSSRGSRTRPPRKPGGGSRLVKSARIAMSLEGAEVTLESSHEVQEYADMSDNEDDEEEENVFNMNTPIKMGNLWDVGCDDGPSRHPPPMTALLDNDMTFSPAEKSVVSVGETVTTTTSSSTPVSPDTPQRVAFCGVVPIGGTGGDGRSSAYCCAGHACGVDGDASCTVGSASSCTTSPPPALGSTTSVTKARNFCYTTEVQGQISHLLGSTDDVDAWLYGWQVWSYRCMGHNSITETDGSTGNAPRRMGQEADAGSVSSSLAEDDEEDQNLQKEHVQRVLRNRAFHVNTRQRRLTKLRRDLHPFGSSQTPSPSLPGHKTVSPFALMTAPPLPMPPSIRMDKKARSFQIPGPHSSLRQQSNINPVTFWEYGLGCTKPTRDDATVDLTVLRSMSIDDDCCYDSDPEDFVHRRGSSPHGIKRVVSLDDGDVGDKENVRHRISERLGRTIDEASVLDEGFDINNDRSVDRVVKSFLNERWTFILHASSKWCDYEAAAAGEADIKSSSCAVYAWIELGTQLSKCIVTPKFVWQSVHGRQIGTRAAAASASGNGSDGGNRIAIQADATSNIDLLDIHRILEVEKVDRLRYPFAKTRNAFLIKTMDQTLLLEARSPVERDRMVRSLKLVVARLGSKLVAGEYVGEFFAVAGQGQGDAAYWIGGYC